MLSEKIIEFNRNLDFKGALPEGVRIMNPFKEYQNVLSVSSAFYKKYYNDDIPRHMILGINPGRFGGGLTGIPFTDPKRITSVCGIEYQGVMAREPSSVYIYDMIDNYGGETSFYSKFYINAVCPLGFTSTSKRGTEINYNYYDSKELQEAVHDFIIQNLRAQIDFGMNTTTCFCLGTGKNYNFLQKINSSNHFFERIIPLEHPRFIMQYKSKTKEHYIKKYIGAFKEV